MKPHSLKKQRALYSLGGFCTTMMPRVGGAVGRDSGEGHPGFLEHSPPPGSRANHLQSPWRPQSHPTCAKAFASLSGLPATRCQLCPGCAQAARAHTTGRLLVTAPVTWAQMPFGLEGPKLVRPVPTPRPRLGLTGTRSIETGCLGKTAFLGAQGSHRVLPADPSANLGEAWLSAVGLGHRHQLNHVPILQMGILRLREW